MRIFDRSSDGLGRTATGTKSTAYTFLRIYRISEESGTLSGGTALFIYMSLILMSEISDSSKNGIGGGLSESAERTVLDCERKLAEKLYISRLTVSFDYS